MTDGGAPQDSPAQSPGGRANGVEQYIPNEGTEGDHVLGCLGRVLPMVVAAAVFIALVIAGLVIIRRDDKPSVQSSSTEPSTTVKSSATKSSTTTEKTETTTTTDEVVIYDYAFVYGGGCGGVGAGEFHVKGSTVEVYVQSESGAETLLATTEISNDKIVVNEGGFTMDVTISGDLVSGSGSFQLVDSTCPFSLSGAKGS